jgi:hypothetical protein
VRRQKLKQSYSRDPTRQVVCIKRNDTFGESNFVDVSLEVPPASVLRPLFFIVQKINIDKTEHGFRARRACARRSKCCNKRDIIDIFFYFAPLYAFFK